jgi:tetratricopeptide (TPR) repeat protein
MYPCGWTGAMLTQMIKGRHRKSPVRGKRSTRGSPKRSPKRKARQTQGAPAGGRELPIEVDPNRIEATLSSLKDQFVAWANKGRYTKVRFKFRGKQLLPDIPLAAVVAAEGLTFYWGGVLRALIFNLAGKTVLEVDLINDSEKQIQRGKDALLAGDVDRALELFREAQAMESSNPKAHLNLGIALKLKGDRGGARDALERARSLDPKGPVGADAERLLASLEDRPTASATASSAE